MSNRRKAKKPWLSGRHARENRGLPAQQVSIPEDEKIVLKRVPAKVDGEVVGTAVLYEDGTSDIVLDDNISDKAKAKMGDVVAAFNKENGASFSIGEVLGKEF